MSFWIFLLVVQVALILIASSCRATLCLVTSVTSQRVAPRGPPLPSLPCWSSAAAPKESTIGSFPDAADLPVPTFVGVSHIRIIALIIQLIAGLA